VAKLGCGRNVGLGVLALAVVLMVAERGSAFAPVKGGKKGGAAAKPAVKPAKKPAGKAPAAAPAQPAAQPPAMDWMAMLMAPQHGLGRIIREAVQGGLQGGDLAGLIHRLHKHHHRHHGKGKGRNDVIVIILAPGAALQQGLGQLMQQLGNPQAQEKQLAGLAQPGAIRPAAGVAGKGKGKGKKPGGGINPLPRR